MPTVSRSGEFTSRPITRIDPLLMGTSALMQRSSVDFPEPDGPMMHTTRPFMTSRLTPLSTSVAPNDLCKSRMATMGSSAVQDSLMCSPRSVVPGAW